MIRVLKESKQVGNISYFVDNIQPLINIIDQGRILSSRKPEYNNKLKKNMKYVSFSRSISAARQRNNARWKWGLVIDGNKLSERYSIEPYSYAGANYNKGTTFRVKSITAYDDNTYTLSLVNWPTIQISEKVFNSIKNSIDNKMSDEMKQKKKLLVSGEGKRIVNGHKIKQKYLFNVPSGGIQLNPETFPKEMYSQLFKTSYTNEYEERVWTSREFIDIENTIIQAIVPNSEFNEADNDCKELIKLCEDKGIKLIYY